MIEVLYFADRSVRQKLFERVSAGQGLLLVTAVRAGKGLGPPGARAPFAELERACGSLLSQVLVADEGKVEGMWRDPLGDFAEALFPDDRAAAYAAATGYLLLSGGALREVVKKSGSAPADAWHLQRAISALEPAVAAPDPRARPRGTAASSSGAASTPPARQAKPLSLAVDPYQLFGVPRGCSRAAAKKRFHALIAQYHPDKVAHLGVEFRELADARTRQILGAWEKICADLDE